MSQQTRFKVTMIIGIFSLILATILLVFKIISEGIWQGFCIGFDLPIVLGFLAGKTTENIMALRNKE